LKIQERIITMIGPSTRRLLEDDILRCPYCVSGETRKQGPDPGRLKVVKNAWLVCQEPDCGRKYPVREDIPVMLIEEGDKWIHVREEDLPEDTGPLVQ